MIPKPAQYLLRFDDLCPTISAERWEQCRRLVEEFGIQPILAVVPDNADSDLDQAAYDPSFWTCLRKMEAAGAAIGVHGYRHLCCSRGGSLLNLHQETEFAGVDFETQCRWIQAGFTILREKGLNPRLWVAPRHGFDRNTLRALRESGVEHISDGFARRPFRRGGLTWIPQQLWAPVPKSMGLWTICIHPGTADAAGMVRVRSFLETHAAAFTSFDRVLKECSSGSLGLGEGMYERVTLWRAQMRNLQRRPGGAADGRAVE
jgi:hypothetical protein